jgi:hypothetical protein
MLRPSAGLGAPAGLPDQVQDRFTSSGSLAMLAAMRRASSRVGGVAGELLLSVFVTAKRSERHSCEHVGG